MRLVSKIYPQHSPCRTHAGPMDNIAHSQFGVSKQAASRARAWYQISKQALAPREPALRRLLKQALVNKWNPVWQLLAHELRSNRAPAHSSESSNVITMLRHGLTTLARRSVITVRIALRTRPSRAPTRSPGHQAGTTGWWYHPPRLCAPHCLPSIHPPATRAP